MTIFLNRVEWKVRGKTGDILKNNL